MNINLTDLVLATGIKNGAKQLHLLITIRTTI